MCLKLMEPVLHIYGETRWQMTKLMASILQKGAQQNIRRRRRRKGVDGSTPDGVRQQWAGASTVPVQ